MITLLVFVGIALGLDGPNAFATQCSRHSPETYYERSDIIFVGTVIDIENEPRFLERGQYVLLNVSKSWKGVDTKTITVNAEGGRFREGNEFLVYADKNFLAMEVTFCGGTIRTESDGLADRELGYLENNHSTIELKADHTMSMNPFPLLGLIGALMGIAIAAAGILKSGITIGMLRKAVPVFAGLIVGVFFIWLFSNVTFPQNMVCYARPLDHIEKLSQIPVMVPTVFPEGYSFQGGEFAMRSRSFSLQYFTKPVCNVIIVNSNSDNHQGDSPLTVFDGVILVSGYPFENRKIGKNLTAGEYVDNLYEEWKGYGSDVDRYSFADGRKAIKVTEQVVESYITHVYVADDVTSTWYEISSNRSAEETVAIAESLRERR